MDLVYMVLQDDLDLTPTIRTPHAAYVDLTPFIHLQDLDRWYTLLAPLPPVTQNVVPGFVGVRCVDFFKIFRCLPISIISFRIKQIIIRFDWHVNHSISIL